MVTGHIIMVTVSNVKLYAISIDVNTLNEFSRSLVMMSIAAEILHILKLLLLVTAFVGFVFYLWFFCSSNDQTQRRLLNILNGYLSIACMGFCPFTYIYDYLNYELQLICFRAGAPFLIAIPTIFLLLSFATILNHFKPDIYLEMSLSWKHMIAVPIIIIFCFLLEILMNYPCPMNFLKCEIPNLRRFLIIPATVTSLICQLIVIVDVSLSWRNLYWALIGLFRSNSVTPVVRIDPEIMATAAQQPYNPTPVLDHHVVGRNLNLFKENCYGKLF